MKTGVTVMAAGTAKDGENDFLQSIAGTELAKRLERHEAEKAAYIAQYGREAYDFKIAHERAEREAAEELERRKARAERLINNSGLGRRFLKPEICFDKLERTKYNEKAFDACRAYAAHFNRHKKGILLGGARGVGKTTLAVATLKELIEKGFIVYFGNIVDIKNRIYKSYDTNTTEEVIERMLDVDLLVIDDLGKETETDNVNELIYKLINTLWNEERGVFITTNLDKAAFIERYDPSVYSRLCDMCEFYRVTGDDYRQKK
jgi:DNA replication protein DnaC